MIKEDAIYARQSVDRMDSISIESQIEYCKYETRGAPYRVYKDKGYSGKNTDRPEFQEMLAAIRRGEIKRVICYKLDRCSRSILDFANMMEEFQRHKVEFVSCTEKFDTSSPMGRAMLNICIVFAQLERETIQQRVTDAYHSRSQRGFYMGGRIPYAFKLEPYLLQGKKTSRYAVCPEEADILYQIYLLYSNPQVSIGDVIKYLGENGIRNSRTKDGHWSKSYLHSIIKNPIYVKADIEVYHFFKNHGTHVLNNPEDFIGTNGCYLFTDTGNKRKSLSLEDHNLVIAPHQGFIPSDIWLRCRRKCMNNKQVAKPIKAKNTWLAGKLKCSRCGYSLVIRKWKHNRYYMCSHRLNNIDACEGVGGLIAEDIETIVFEALSRKIAELGRLTSQTLSYDSPRISELKIKIAQYQNDAENLISKMEMADATLMRYINQKITEIDEKKEALERELGSLEDQKRSTQVDVHEISNCLTCWEKLSNQDKLTVVDAFITSITASKEGVSIQWKL